MDAVRRSTEALARGIGVHGLLNVQYALKDGVLYVLEANPRASRTVPFVSKATAVPLAKAASRIMLGATLADLRDEGVLPATGDGAALPARAPIAVKEAVLPFHRFCTPEGRGIDPLLGPEMKSTGEVMGIDVTFGRAYAKSQIAVHGAMPVQGCVMLSLGDRDESLGVLLARRLAGLGFRILATQGTAAFLYRNGLDVAVMKGGDGEEQYARRIQDNDIKLVIDTSHGQQPAHAGERELRSAAVSRGIPCVTTIEAAEAVVRGIEEASATEPEVRALQEWHRSN